MTIVITIAQIQIPVNIVIFTNRPVQFEPAVQRDNFDELWRVLANEGEPEPQIELLKINLLIRRSLVRVQVGEPQNSKCPLTRAYFISQAITGFAPTPATTTWLAILLAESSEVVLL